MIIIKWHKVLDKLRALTPAHLRDEFYPLPEGEAA